MRVNKISLLSLALKLWHQTHNNVLNTINNINTCIIIQLFNFLSPYIVTISGHVKLWGNFYRRKLTQFHVVYQLYSKELPGSQKEYTNKQIKWQLSADWLTFLLKMWKLALQDSHTISGEVGLAGLVGLARLVPRCDVVYACVVWMSSRTKLAPCPIQKDDDT